MTTLYTMTAAMAALRAALEDPDAPEDVGEVLAAWWASAEGDLGHKIDGMLNIAAELDGVATMRKNEAARLAALASGDETRAASIRARVKEAVEAIPGQRIETPRWRASIARAGGRQAIEVTCPAEDLPADCVRYTASVDKDRLREILESGETIEGARLLPRSTYLKVK